MTATDSLPTSGESPEGSQAIPGAKDVWRLVVRRALRRCCPQCGRGALFRRFARLHAECADCGLVYRREQGAMTGSMYLSAAVTELFAAAIILGLVFGTDWEPWLQIAVGLPVVVVFCYAFLPYSMGLWVAIEYLTDLANKEAWARPRVADRSRD